MLQVAADLARRDRLGWDAPLGGSFLCIEPGHRSLQGGRVALLEEPSCCPLALMSNPRQCQGVGTRPAQRVVQRDRGRDVGCAEADPFKDKRHKRLEVDPWVALTRDTQVLSTGRPLWLWRHSPEGLACIDVAVAILVADEPAPTCRAFEH